jgi:predicted protein tyrosine phosphatase
MKIKVMSRSEIEDAHHYGLATSDMEKHIVISITSSKTNTNLHKNKKEFYTTRLGELFLNFDDVDYQTDLGNITLISEQDIINILEFVNKYVDKIDGMIVQCDAGISRSAGAAASLSKILSREDDFYFDNYLPNMRVYSSLLDYYYKNESKYENMKEYIISKIGLGEFYW